MPRFYDIEHLSPKLREMFFRKLPNVPETLVSDKYIPGAVIDPASLRRGQIKFKTKHISRSGWTPKLLVLNDPALFANPKIGVIFWETLQDLLDDGFSICARTKGGIYLPITADILPELRDGFAAYAKTKNVEFEAAKTATICEELISQNPSLSADQILPIDYFLRSGLQNTDKILANYYQASYCSSANSLESLDTAWLNHLDIYEFNILNDKIRAQILALYDQKPLALQLTALALQFIDPDDRRHLPELLQAIFHNFKFNGFVGSPEELGAITDECSQYFNEMQHLIAIATNESLYSSKISTILSRPLWKNLKSLGLAKRPSIDQKEYLAYPEIAGLPRFNCTCTTVASLKSLLDGIESLKRLRKLRLDLATKESLQLDESSPISFINLSNASSLQEFSLCNIAGTRNQLTEIFSNLPLTQLEILTLNNFVYEKDIIQNFSLFALKTCTNLRELNLPHAAAWLTSDMQQELFKEVLDNLPKLTCLNLSYNDLSKLPLEQLVKIASCKNLRALYLSDCHLTDEQLKALFAILPTLPNLEVLYLGDNDIQADDLLQILPRLSNLKTLNLSREKKTFSRITLNTEQCTTLSRTLEQFRKLIHINFEFKVQPNDKIEQLFESLKDFIVSRVKPGRFSIRCLNREEIIVSKEILAKYGTIKKTGASAPSPFGHGNIKSAPSSTYAYTTAISHAASIETTDADTKFNPDDHTPHTPTEYFPGIHPELYRLIPKIMDPQDYTIQEVILKPTRILPNVLMLPSGFTNAATTNADIYNYYRNYVDAIGEVLLESNTWNRLPSLSADETLRFLSLPEGVTYELAQDEEHKFYLIKPTVKDFATVIPCKFSLNLKNGNLKPTSADWKILDIKPLTDAIQSKACIHHYFIRSLYTTSREAFIRQLVQMSSPSKINLDQKANIIHLLHSYFYTFTEGKIPQYHSVNEADKLWSLIQNRKGSCYHRSRAFLFALQLLKQYANIEIKAQLLTIADRKEDGSEVNGLHENVEVDLNDRLLRLDFGGYPAKVECTPAISTEQKEAVQIKTPEELFIARKKTETRAKLENYRKITQVPFANLEDSLAKIPNKNKQVFIVATTEQGETLATHLQHILNEQQRAFYMVNNFDDLSMESDLHIEDGKEQDVPSALANFLNNNKGQRPLIIINLDHLDPSERVRMQSIYEKPPKIGTIPLPDDIVIYTVSSKQTFEETDKINPALRWRLGNAAEITSTPAIIAPNPDSATKTKCLQMYYDTDWEPSIVGEYGLQNYIDGVLQECCRHGITHLVLQNPPPKNTKAGQKLCDLVATINTIGAYRANGETHPLPPGFKIIFQEVPLKLETYPSLLAYKIDSTMLAQLGAHYLINLDYFDSLFTKPQIEGWLKKNANKTIKLVITESLPESQWAKLLDAAKAKEINCSLEVYIYPGVLLPSVFKEKDMRASATTTATTQIEPSPKPDFIVPITEHTGYSEIMQKPQIVIGADGKKAVFFENCNVLKALLAGKTVVLEISKNEKIPEDFLHQIAPALAEKSFIDEKGEKHYFPGTLILSTTDPIPASSKIIIPNNPELTAEKFEQTRIDAVLSSLKAGSPMICIEGGPATSKSYFFRNILPHALGENTRIYGGQKSGDWLKDAKEEETRIYVGLDNVDAWLKDTKPGRKILFIDEFTLQDQAKLNMLAGIYGNPPMINDHILAPDHQSLEHQILCAFNPESFGFRKLPNFVKHYSPPTIAFTDPPQNYLENILNGIWHSLEPKEKEKLQGLTPQDLNKVILSFYTRARNVSTEITLRDLQLMALFFLALVRKKSVNFNNTTEILGYLNYACNFELSGHLLKTEKQNFKQQLTDQEIADIRKVETLQYRSLNKIKQKLKDELTLTECYDPVLNVLRMHSALDKLRKAYPVFRNSAGHGVIIQGPPGSGKSAIAKLYYSKYKEFLFDDQMDNECTATNRHRLFQCNPYSTDELEKIVRSDHHNGDTLTLDDGDAIPLEHHFNEILQEGDLDLRLTSNSSKYDGRVGIAAPFRSRCYTIELTPDEEAITSILQKKGLREDQIRELAEIYHYNPDITPRELWEIADMVKPDTTTAPSMTTVCAS